MVWRRRACICDDNGQDIDQLRQVAKVRYANSAEKTLSMPAVIERVAQCEITRASSQRLQVGPASSLTNASESALRCKLRDLLGHAANDGLHIQGRSAYSEM